MKIHPRSRDGVRATGHRHMLPVGLKVRGLRGPSMRSVPCLDCGAEIGAPCVSASGAELSNVHISRRRIAIRRWQEQQVADE